VDFEWDEDKRAALKRWRNIDLLRAVRIFEGPVWTTQDRRHDYGEDRYISIGEIEEEYFVVVHTPRQGAIRVVTAWRAGSRLQRQYQARLAGGDPEDG
jgi:uncharacterized DUF497 family protein